MTVVGAAGSVATAALGAPGQVATVVAGAAVSAAATAGKVGLGAVTTAANLVVVGGKVSELVPGPSALMGGATEQQAAGTDDVTDDHASMGLPPGTLLAPCCLRHAPRSSLLAPCSLLRFNNHAD